MSKIFINYRRSTDHASAGRINDRLVSSFGEDDVFFDVDGIVPGSDFVQVLSERVSDCVIFLAIIGKNWLDIVDDEGNTRISDPNDWVRVEIESALTQGKRVIPVLVDGATMPKESKLPAALSPLARRQAVEVSHKSFRSDMERLIGQIAVFRAAEEERRRQEEASKAAEEERTRREEARRAAEERTRREEARKAADEEEARRRRAGPSTSHDKPDPLAELARLVGQDDPFRALLQAGAQGRTHEAVATHGAQDQAGAPPKDTRKPDPLAELARLVGQDAPFRYYPQVEPQAEAQSLNGENKNQGGMVSFYDLNSEDLRTERNDLLRRLNNLRTYLKDEQYEQMRTRIFRDLKAAAYDISRLEIEIQKTLNDRKYKGFLNLLSSLFKN